MKDTDIAKALAKAVEPFVRQLAADLTKLAARSVAEQLDVARAHAVSKLREQLEGTTPDVEEHDERSGDSGADRRVGAGTVEATPRRDAGSDRGDRRSRTLDRSRDQDDAAAGTEEAPQAAEPVAKRTRAKMACGKCGAIGFRSDGCGRTHNLPEKGQTSDEPARVEATESKSAVKAPVPEAMSKRGAPRETGNGPYTPPPPSQRVERIGSRASRQPHVPGAKAGDVDEEPEPVGGVMQPPVKIRRMRRRSRPRAVSFGNANRATGHGFSKLDAKLGIRAGAPIEFNLDELRPKTRGECIAGIRPCVFVGCRHHLYLDINPDTGSIKLNFPELELEQLAETCVLDVADRGGITLEKTGEFLNLTRERARQIELKAYAASQAAPLIAELRSA